MYEKLELFKNQTGFRTALRQQILTANSRLALAIYLNIWKCMIGRLPILSYFIVKNLDWLCNLELSGEMLDVYFALGGMCVYLSYTASFFTFYQGNSLFRKVVHGKLGKTTPTVKISPTSTVEDKEKNGRRLVKNAWNNNTSTNEYLSDGQINAERTSSLDINIRY